MEQRRRRMAAYAGFAPITSAPRSPQDSVASASVVAGLLLRRAARVVLLQPPATPDVTEQRPPAVAQRRQPPPGAGGQAQQRPDGRPGGAAVGDRDEQRPGPELVEPLHDALGRPRAHLGVGLPSAAARVL